MGKAGASFNLACDLNGGAFDLVQHLRAVFRAKQCGEQLEWVLDTSAARDMCRNTSLTCQSGPDSRNTPEATGVFLHQEPQVEGFFLIGSQLDALLNDIWGSACFPANTSPQSG